MNNLKGILDKVKNWKRILENKIAIVPPNSTKVQIYTKEHKLIDKGFAFWDGNEVYVSGNPFNRRYVEGENGIQIYDFLMGSKFLVY